MQAGLHRHVVGPHHAERLARPERHRDEIADCEVQFRPARGTNRHGRARPAPERRRCAVPCGADSDKAALRKVEGSDGIIAGVSRPARPRRSMPSGCRATTLHIRLRRRGRGTASLAGASRRRAAHVAEDRRGLSSATCASSFGFLTEHLGEQADAEGARRARAARRARLHGGAARRRHRRALADALARRRALVRALSGAQRQGQGRRAHRGARAEGRRRPCRSRSASRPPSA